MKTTAAVLTKLKRPLELLELTLPSLKKGQIQVRIQKAGLCRTQLNEVKGTKGSDRYLPHLLGHEAAGTVEKIGPGVTTVKPDDTVILSWIKGAGLDVPGGIYHHGRQRVNAGGVAVFTQHAVVSENRVTKISRRLPADVAALLGCAVATGAGVVRHTLNVQPQSSIAIFGVGGVGASAIMMTKYAQATPIIAIDVTPGKLRWAKQLGATHTINAARRDPVAAIARLVPGGVDYAIEAAGIPAVIEQAFAALAASGTLAITGHPAHGSRVSFDPFAFIQGRRVVGTWGGATIPNRDFPWYARQFQAGKLPLEKLITHTFPLTEINTALATLEKGTAGRIIIDCEE